MRLTYPQNFTSPLTYQNSNYTFPHQSILSLNVKDLIPMFYSDQYILPDYISYVTNDNIIDILKSNNDFTILGVSFMKFKGLAEQWENLIKTSLDWKSSHTHKKFQSMIDLIENDEEMIYKIDKMTNIIQIMIVNIIDEVSKGGFPDWMNTDLFHRIIALLEKIIHLPILSIAVSETIYVATIIPLLYELEKEMNKIMIV